MLRLGLLGVGDAGSHHARALAAAHADPAAAIAWSAVGARDVVKTAARCAEFGMPADTRIVFPEELLGGELCDAIIIATPDGLHYEHALAALQSGMHVLVEKPIALTLVHASELIAAARAKDRVLQVGYHLRHHAGHEAVRAGLADLVGELRTIYARWAWPDPATDGWRAQGVGARWWSLAALGTHLIDLGLWLANAPVTDAVCVREPPQGVDRAAEVSLRFASGVLAHLSVAITHRAPSILSLVGDVGEIVCEETFGARGGGTIELRAGKHATPITFAEASPYLRQLRAFASRCGGGHSPVDAHAITNLELLQRITPS
jgi:predicted dehydrogenase